MANYPHLFSPLRLGSIEIENRIFSSGHMPRAMSIEEIAEVVEWFGSGAARMQKAGLDGVFLHQAQIRCLSHRKVMRTLDLFSERVLPEITKL